MNDQASMLENDNAKFKRDLIQREGELAVINSVQQALTAELDMQGIYDTVGNKIRDVFDAQGVQLITFDHKNNIMYRLFVVEKGQRLYVDPIPINKLWSAFVRMGKTWIVDNLQNLLKEIDPDFTPPAGEIPKSALLVPLINKGEIYSAISLSNIDRESAFRESDARLLETIASSMSLALENARLFAETQRLLKETDQRASELQIINSVQQGLASHLEVQAIYDLVGDKIRDIFNAQVVMISTYDRQTDTIEHRYAIERGERIYAPGHHPIRGFRIQVVETRQTVLVGTHVAELASQLGQPTLPGTITPKTWLGVPLIVDDQVTGILSLQDVDQENAFGESVVRLLQTLAASMSVALENARLWEQEKLYLKALEREFEIGRQIQAGFLPDTLPQPKGWEIAALLKSASEVAGDFYDVFELPEGRIGLVIADVCDKGLGAALFMTLFRSLLRAVSNLDFFVRVESGDGNSSAARLRNAISLTNNYIVETHGNTGMFATIFFGILDPRTGILTYINGGHLPPMLVNKHGVREVLKFTGPAVGAAFNADYAIREVVIELGDTFFACTDGLTDTANPAGEYFSEKGLLPLQSGDQTLTSLLAQLQNQIENYAAGAKQIDDITMLAVRRS